MEHVLSLTPRITKLQLKLCSSHRQGVLSPNSPPKESPFVFKQNYYKTSSLSYIWDWILWVHNYMWGECTVLHLLKAAAISSSLHPSTKEKRRNLGPGRGQRGQQLRLNVRSCCTINLMRDSRDDWRLFPRAPLAFIIRTFSEARFCSTCDDGQLLLPGESVFSSLHTCWVGFVSLPCHTGTNFEILRGKKAILTILTPSRIVCS